MSNNNSPNNNQQIQQDEDRIFNINVQGSEKELIQEIIKHSTYQPSQQFNNYFQSTLNTLILESEYKDNRRLGQILGMAVLGLVGFVASGFFFIGIIAGGFVGGAVGWFAGKRIKKRIKRNKNLKHFDLYLISIGCYIVITENQVAKYKNNGININQFRYYLQKSLKEFKAVNYYNDFTIQNQKKFLKFIKKFNRILQNPLGQKSIQLILNIAKELQLIYNQDRINENPINIIQIQELVNIVQNYLQPAHEILNLQQNLKGELQQINFEMSFFLTSDNIKQILQQYQNEQRIQSKEFIEKMDKEVQIEDIRELFKGYDLEDIIIRKIKEERENQSDQKNGRLIDYIQATINKQKGQIDIENSQEGSQDEDICERSSFKNEIQIQLKNSSFLKGKDSKSECIEKTEKFKNTAINIHYNLRIDDDQPKQQHSCDEPQNGDIQSLRQSKVDCVSMRSRPKAKHVIFIKMNSLNDIENFNPKSEHFSQSNYKDDNSHTIVNIHSKKNQPIIQDTEVDEKMLKLNSLCEENISLWETVLDRPECQIYKKYEPGNPVVVLRSEAILLNCTQKETFDQIYNEQLRVKWDTYLQEFRTIQKIDETRDIIYFFLDPGFAVSKRDFLQKRSWRKDFPKKGDISIIFFSTEHPLYPPKKGFVRVNSIISGYIIQQIGKNTILKIIACTDIKGFVPKFVVNTIAAKAPAKWIDSLRQAMINARIK